MRKQVYTQEMLKNIAAQGFVVVARVMALVIWAACDVKSLCKISIDLGRIK